MAGNVTQLNKKNKLKVKNIPFLIATFVVIFTGSPFQFTVGPITDGGAHKVRAIGPGLERGEVNKQSEFNIYTREAGAGGLSIAVEGPSKAEIDFQDKKDGSCNVAYTATEPGKH